MATASIAMSNETFYGFMYPRQNRRFYLALVCSIVLFPLVAIGLILGTVFFVVPLAALVIWIGMRVFFAYMLGNSVLVSAQNYPRIFAITEDIKVKLGYSKPIYVFVYEQGTFNAYMQHFFLRRAIFLNSELLQNGVSDPEIRWLIGRFVGYMRARKQAGFLGWVIRAAQKLLIFNFFILPYERAMVYTGDRLALAEIGGELVYAISAMQKILVGRKLGYSINPEGLIAQHRQIRGSFFGFLARVDRAFPHTTARYVDLILFARAFFPEQFKVFESANPGLPADLSQLGLSQLTESGKPRVAHAPWAWTCAGITMLALAVLGAWAWPTMSGLIAPPMNPASFEVVMPPASDDNAALPSVGEPEPFSTPAVVGEESTPLDEESVPALTEQEASPMGTPPPNTHFEAGQAVPNPDYA
ncbi:MAG TPA: hypothetical protein VGS22_30455 [Thermoanaerobaculia bacterium]|jgi:hypothetical protein|nr:hypothetical protein [Thermoanaerobaculia bacterium]